MVEQDGHVRIRRPFGKGVPEALPAFFYGEIVQQTGCRQGVRKEMRQQGVSQFAVRVRDVAPVDFIEQGVERRHGLPPERRRADESSQRRRADVLVPTVVPDDAEQQFRHGRQWAGRRAQYEVDEALVFGVAARLAQDLSQQPVEIGGHERPGT